MTKRAIAWILWGWVAAISVLAPVQAAHVIGGNITISPRNNLTGVYDVCVTLYYDANSSDPNAEQSEITVSFFRKFDNARLSDLRLKQTSKQPLPFTNPGCAASRNLKINVVQFCAETRLPLSEYAHQDGYYVSWERCCRSADVRNLKGAGTSSLVLYAEFPPVSTANHSPVFGAANGEILCRNTAYTFESGATDPDGDELRYRLDTPFSSTRPPYGIDPLAPSTAGPYPKSEWANGFGTANPVPSQPAFSLDPKTGTIRLTPTETGLFVYRVVVEEYRGGRKLGESHRDYQLLVIDCNTDNPPPVAIEDALLPPGATIAEGDSLIDVGICRGDTIQLKAESNPQFAYQWQRDGVNLKNASGPAITITQEGVYSVVKTFADRCGNASTLGEKFGVKYRLQEKVNITPGPKASVCEGTPLDLTVNIGGAGWSFRWQKDGKALPGATFNTLSGVTEAGVYIVKAANIVTQCVSSDTVTVRLNTRPPASITAPAREVCQGDSVVLQTNAGKSFTYVWYQAQTPQTNPIGPINLVKQSGLYSVEVRDTTTGCSRRSDTLRITVKPAPEVLFDSIPSLCGQADAKLSLSATPTGGIFSGKGVSGNTFDANQAGLGSHPVVYTYKAPNGCTATATQTARVTSAPRAFLGNNKVIVRGDSLQLRSSVTDGATYEWSPPLGLSNPNVAQPTASPTQTTTYRLRVSMANGCFSESEIVIEVLPPVKIPNGFTPNGDGTNDTWEIENSAAYLDCEVEIFNRWGNRVFSSKGYDKDWGGQFNNEDLPAATYYYVIKLHPDLPVKSGSVTIFR
ncbi:gliding motility-associated C-terminal domain-containing protein [Persicitalea jodogahamensis]|uniref:gliding motility-associated C-terminal domain-containing protein n=1 Tax=Persicitalea jodogahamensis TaxID=402147 RepID=UPI0016746393|nr:gliding motility-associated C-terminal domain-containing protein [Persicitalea jodogahamensis]